MITVQYNPINKSVDLLMDRKGVDVLSEKLSSLKEEYDHVHIYATGDDRGLSLHAIHDGEAVFGELILELRSSDDWA